MNLDRFRVETPTNTSTTHAFLYIWRKRASGSAACSIVNRVCLKR